MAELRLYNTLTGRKEVFEPLHPPFVGLYVCGPTVYNDVHLGNCRTFLTFDILRRWLTWLGYRVRYVRNITDAGHLENDADDGEDKIGKKARLEQLEPMEVVQRYTVRFHEVMRLMNILPPSIEPTATGHIIEQIQMVEKILAEGLAYVVNGSVYFDVMAYERRYGGYGALSGRKLDELIAGAGAERRTLEGQDEKRHPADFALWKKASPQHIMRWPSPWGEGFPGWHIECSAMSTKYLGAEFDIHGGGFDLKFPHHECERAQNTAFCGKGGPLWWMHSNMLTVQGKRMGKSEGNAFWPHEIFSGNHSLLPKAYAPVVLRYMMMQAHYRSTLDFTPESLDAAEKNLEKIKEALRLLPELTVSDTSDFDWAGWIESITEALNDDLNVPLACARLLEGLKHIGNVARHQEKISSEDAKRLEDFLPRFVSDVLGLTWDMEKEDDASCRALLDGVMEMVIELRNEARKARNYSLSDHIRDSLQRLGIQLADTKDGTTWHH